MTRSRFVPPEWTRHPKLFERRGRSLDIFECPRWTNGGRECRCPERCVICTLPKHSPYHGAVFRRAVGSPPWGHEFAQNITPQEAVAMITEVDSAVVLLPDVIRDDVRQDTLLSLLTEGKPLDLHRRVTEKVGDAWRRLDRFKLVSLESPVNSNANGMLTLGEMLVG